MTDCRVCATPLPTDARFCMACGVDVTDPGSTARLGVRSPASELQERLTRTLAGRYAVKKLLGAGGMAAVFLADEIGLERPVAIKVLPPELSRDESLVTRFEREARTAARLDHPHIIPIYRVESESGLHYFVMKFVAGRSLDSLLRDGAPMEIALATRILREAALALGHAHTRGVVHRDVKPANIMLDQDDRVVLTDFGISKAGEGTQLTQTGMIIGTPDYMAPEQALGLEVDGRADQYALGVVAYQMLTGACPFAGGSAATLLYRHIHETPTPIAERRPDVPSHLADAVAVALAKEPAHRFATMEELARAIDGDTSVRAAWPSQATVAVPAARQAPPAARAAPMRRIAIASTVGLLVVAGAALVRSNRQPAAPSTAVTPSRVALVADSTGSAATSADTSAASTSAEASPVVPQGSLAKRGEPRAPARAPLRSRPAAERVEPSTKAERTERWQTAALTVASEPYGVLFIDDVEIGDTPVANRPLEVGRSYRIRVEREGYRTKRETIVVTGPNAIRRNYVLDPGGAP
jgi:serine/threonine-protein kinase